MAMQQEDKIPSQCAVCDFIVDQDAVVEHYLREEIEVDEIPFICVTCGYVTNARGKMWEH